MNEIEEQLASLRRSAPASVEQGVLVGTGIADGYRTYDSPVGEVIVTFNPRGVSAVELADDAAFDDFRRRFGRDLIEARPPAAWGSSIERAIERGTPGSLPVDFRSVTEFQASVLRVAARIPFGQVRPYGWLARQVGNPGASRAVGSTMSGNPVPLIVPCHRVVRSDGTLGKYSLGGPRNKVALLEHEGADVAELSRLATRGVRYVGSDTTGVFCHPTCHNARRITDAHRVEFRTAADATAAGFRACQVCEPV